MKVNPILATAIITAMFALLGWLCIEMVAVKVQVARISEHLHIGAEGTVGQLEHEPMAMTVGSTGE